MKKKDFKDGSAEQEQKQPSQNAQAEQSEKETSGVNEKACKEAEAGETQDKAQEYYGQLVRLQADFENYRKRVEKEKPLFIQYGKMEVLRHLVPMYDILLKAKCEVNKEGAELEHLKQGLKMIFEEFERFFKAQGVQIVCSKGKPYDPMTQEVVTTCPCAEEEDGKVIEELANGVVLDGKVIRPAQVIVGKREEDKQDPKKEKQEKQETK